MERKKNNIDFLNKLKSKIEISFINFGKIASFWDIPKWNKDPTMIDELLIVYWLKIDTLKKEGGSFS